MNKSPFFPFLHVCGWLSKVRVGVIFIQQKLCMILSNRTYWLNDSHALVPDASLIWWNWPQTKTDCFSNVAKKPKLDRLIAMLKTMPKPIWGKHYRTSYAFLCFFAHVFFAVSYFLHFTPVVVKHSFCVQNKTITCIFLIRVRRGPQCIL